jgi:hypothetical protein
MQDPVYWKQFKIPEAHHQSIKQTLDEWLKLGFIKRSNSLYNSPIFCVPKKQGQGLRILQDFRELSQNSHIDKYSNLQSFVDDTTLNWETFLPALAISHNTSYHFTIATMPFELLFGKKARLPSFPNKDIQQIHYGETSAAE